MFDRKLKSFAALTVLSTTFLIFQNCAQMNSTYNSSAAASEADAQGFTDINQHPDIVLDKEILQTSYDPVITDRIYTFNLLSDIFGPTVASVDSSKLLNDEINYGSPCSLYEQYNVLNSAKKPALADSMNACSSDPGPATLGADINPKPTVTRQASLMKTCTDLVQNAGTLAFALNRISSSSAAGTSAGTSAAVPQPTSDNLQTLFGLFYRGKPPASADLIQSLQVMFDPSNITSESWKAPIYTVCVSSHWQEI